MWQVKLADHDFDIDAEIILVPEDFSHTPTGILRGCRPVRDLDINHNVFEISPVGTARGFFAEDAMLGFRRTSFVVRSSRRLFASTAAFCF